jgi:hypothetical protein
MEAIESAPLASAEGELRLAVSPLNEVTRSEHERSDPNRE